MKKRAKGQKSNPVKRQGSTFENEVPYQTTLKDIERYHLEECRSAAQFLIKEGHDEPETVIKILMEKNRGLANYSLVRDGFSICRRGAEYGHQIRNKQILRSAVHLADALRKKYITPQGTFVEWDWNTWLKPEVHWRTIPWGVGFCGSRMLEVWSELKDEMTSFQRKEWCQSMEKMGRWIHKNPVVGGYVFNLGIDLCALLWKIGHELEREEWSQWALETAAKRLDRDMDEEGWIQAEDGGASGHYHPLGADFLARFAWETRDPILEEATLRTFSKSAMYHATENLDWTGNFGTRTSGLEFLPSHLVLMSAVLGDSTAAWMVKKHARILWESELGNWPPPEDLTLWRQAFACQAVPPTYPAIIHLKGISETVVREGPWTAYFGNYDRSIWTRGFNNLWHSGHQDWVFSTLHSLPRLPDSIRKKMQMDEKQERDWAGFPHVRVMRDGDSFDTHRRILDLRTQKDAKGVEVRWSEPLLNGKEEQNGLFESIHRFHGNQIDMDLKVRDITGACQLDFHFLRRTKGFARIWNGKEIEDYLAGRLLSTHGGYETQEIGVDAPRLCGIQLDRVVFVFKWSELPRDARLTLVGDTPIRLHTPPGLHSSPGHNEAIIGGFRFRIEFPAGESSRRIKLTLQAIDLQES